MARNGSGTYNRAVSPYVAGTTITAATVNSEMDDIATALTGSMARDGQSPATANIPMGGFRLTGLGNAISNTDAAAFGQVLAKAGDTATGALGVIAGTAAAPGVFVSGDTNTGLFQPAADTLAVTVGGAEVARFGANGLQSASPWVDLAGAATTDLGAQTSTNLRITGNFTTITAFGTAANGVTRNLRFTGVLTLTHNATSLILPGAANITSAQGDTATAVSLGSGNWVVTDFQRASALPALQGLITGSGLTVATSRVLGRVTAGSGAIEEIPLGNAAAALSLGINRGTEQATTSGTAIDFTGIPAGVRRVTVMLDQVSTNSTSHLTIRLGTSGGIVATGYDGIQGVGDSVPAAFSNISTGFDMYNAAVGEATTGRMVLENQSGNLWLCTFQGFVAQGASRYSSRTSGRVSLSGALTQLRLTTLAGTPTFDAGAINIMWEF